MKQLIAILFFILPAFNVHCQPLKQYPIGETGCTAKFCCDPAIHPSKNPDSSGVYQGVCSSGNMTYGLICFKMKKRIKNLQKCEDAVIAYLDHLKVSFDIVSAAGYGKGQRLKSDQDTRGVLDYWKTKDKENWKVKCWTDGRYMGFMYVHSKRSIDEYQADTFLSSLLFPGM